LGRLGVVVTSFSCDGAPQARRVLDGRTGVAALGGPSYQVGFALDPM